MSNITDPRLLWIKGGLFVVLGLIAFVLVAILSGSISVVVAAAIAIWAFCRAYYFAFYVIEHYIDGRYRFAGLMSVLSYWLSGPSATETGEEAAEPFIDAPTRRRRSEK